MNFTQSNFKGVSVFLSVSDCTLGLVRNRRYEAPLGRVVLRIQQVVATPSEVRVSLKVVFMAQGNGRRFLRRSGPTSGGGGRWDSRCTRLVEATSALQP